MRKETLFRDGMLSRLLVCSLHGLYEIKGYRAGYACPSVLLPA
jgi:hypothetical protein